MNIYNTSSQDGNTKFNNPLIMWGAVIAGVIVALGTEALFNLLGLGLGLIAFNFDIDMVSGLGISSYIWLMLAGISSMMVGGWIAGLVTGSDCAYTGALHGLIAWALATLITFALVTTAVGTTIGGMATMFGNALSAAEEAVAVNEKKSMGENTSLEEEMKNIQPNIDAFKNEIKQQTQQEQTKETAEKSSKALGTIAIVTFLSFFLSAITSMAGASLAVRMRK